MYDVQQTTDGGFSLAGYSGSGISGDRTQANWGSGFFLADYWTVKTDVNSTKQ